jgi:putative copper export protein
VIERLLRLENLWVVGLLLVAALVALEARWRNDPERAGTARAISRSIRIGLGVLVGAIVLFLLALLLIGPIGSP